MDKSEPSDPEANGRPRPAARRVPAAGFSLVEVTLALGVMAFSFVAVFGMLPVGMNSFQQAMNTTVGGEIAQRVINDAFQTDFSDLLKDGSGATIAPTASGTKMVRYFDVQGDEIIPTTPGAPTAAEKQKALYWVNTRVVAATVPPAGGNTTQGNVNVATVTVQVASNPGGQNFALSSSNLWNGSGGAVNGLITRSVFVARNQ